jgi:rRNA-processing protein FCF1
MKKIAIQDANILIDLVKTGLFGECLALPYEFLTTDIILAELHDSQIELIGPHILAAKFSVIKISATELVQIQLLSAQDSRLSEQDWSAYYYARQKNALLLTGDKRLRILAESNGIITCGIFWILDQLVGVKAITKADACSFLQSLIASNKRLPASEYTSRFNLWCKVDEVISI